MENIQRLIRGCFGIIAVFFLASTAYLQAQGPYTGGNLTIKSDADVPSNVATITTIDGILRIEGTITSFPNFAALEVVETHLQILRLSSTTLTTLTGIFPALREVKKNFSINLNSELTTVSGFDMLTTITGKLTIFNNAKLTTISGFGAITSIGTDSGTSIDVRDNGMLSSCCGLIRFVDGTTPPTGATMRGNAPGCNSPAEIIADCRSVSINAPDDVPGDVATIETIGDLTIGGTIATFPDFAALTAVEGNLIIRGLTDTNLTDLANIFLLLETVGGDLLIQNNANLLTIAGFVALREVGGNVEIGSATLGQGNGALTAAPALNALTTIGGNLLIANNGSLTTAPVLSGLTTLTGNFTVQDNTQLASCCDLLRVFDDVVRSGVTSLISGNAAGCEGETETRTACAPPPVILDKTVTITADGEVPDNATEVTRITGNLEISGTITSFPNFAVLEVVQGNLTIDNITTGTLTDLSGIFPALDSVYGTLTIQNQTVVQTIAGFASLDSVGGGISIINNKASLTTLPPFDALKGVEGGITIEDNAGLTTVSGFTALTTITGSLNIRARVISPTTRGPGNIALTTVSGFGALTSIEGSLELVSNPVLTALPTFPELTSIDGDFFIDTNIALTSVSGFGVLESVGNDLYIEDNALLVTLPPFGALSRVGQDIIISSNAKLTPLSGFGALTTVRDININNNDALTEISSFVAKLTGIGGSITIAGNDVLATISGFDMLASVTDNLGIGDAGNLVLTTLPTFAALTTIGGSLRFVGNRDLDGFTALCESYGCDKEYYYSAAMPL